MAREALGTKAKRKIIYRIQNTCSNCRQLLIDDRFDQGGYDTQVQSCRHIMGKRRTIRKTDEVSPSGYCALYEPDGER